MNSRICVSALVCVTLALCSFSATPSYATLIDFEGLPFTFITSGGDNVPNPASVLTDDFLSVGVRFGRAGVSTGVAVVQDSFAPSSGVNSVAGLNASGVIPGSQAGGAAIGDIYFNFVLPSTLTPGLTDLVSFTVGDSGGDLDQFVIRAFDLSDAVIDTQIVSGVSRFGVTIATAGIHRVEINFSGDFGYTLDDLAFNTPTPEPATLWMLTLGGLALLRRRRG